MRRVQVPLKPSSDDRPSDEEQPGVRSWSFDRTQALPVDIVFRAVLGTVLLAAVGGQIRVWLSDRGLWNDEIYIANSLKYLSFKGLTGRLLYEQIAPPGWLIGEKALLRVLGPDEQILKVPEILAAIAIICLTAFAAYRSIGRLGAVVAAGLIAIAPMIYYYAGELKQYEVEAAAAMVIIVAAASIGGVARRGELSKRYVLVFAAVVAVASAGSYTAVVVLGGAAAGLVALFAASRRIWAAAIVGLACAPGLAVGIRQAIYRRELGVSPNQWDYFPHGNPPEGSGPIGTIRWLPQMWHWLLVNPFDWRFPLVAALLVAGGLVALVVRKQVVLAAVLGGVFVGAVGSAVVHGLPLEDRVSLYLVAPVAVAVAAGIDATIRLVAHTARQRPEHPGADRAATVRIVLAGALAAAAVAGLGAMVWPAATASYHEVVSPRVRDDGREMLKEVADRVQPGDVVLSYYFSEPLLKWYGSEWGLNLVGLAAMVPAKQCDPTSLGRAISGAKRVWYVRSAIYSKHPAQYSDWVVAALARKGTIVDEHTGFKASGGWTLVDLTKGPDPSPPPLSTNPAYACLNVSKVPHPQE
jgi:hypothetical protein